MAESRLKFWWGNDPGAAVVSAVAEKAGAKAEMMWPDSLMSAVTQNYKISGPDEAVQKVLEHFGRRNGA